MPALPSFMSYRPQLGKVKSSFALAKRRLEGGPSTSSISQQPTTSQEVLDIGDSYGKNSMDFFDAGPSALSEENMQTQTPNFRGSSPHLQLDLDLSTDTDQFSDWFSTSFPRPEPSPKGHGLRNPLTILEAESEDEGDGDLVREEEVFEDSIEMMPSGDVIANLEAMNASSFGRLRPESITPSSGSPSRLKIPLNQQQLISANDEDGVYSNKSRPTSQVSSPLGSAVSGTTLARQLIGNGFSLSHDRRASAASRFRNGAGLTRSDSTTLPRGDYDDERFEVDPNAPPIPRNADVLYVPPKQPREGPTRPRIKTLKRRSSTGSIAMPDSEPPLLPNSPQPRPTSEIVSPTELHAAFPLSPLGRSPSPTPDADSFPLPPGFSQDRRHIPPAINVSTAFGSGSSGQGDNTPTTGEGVVASPEDVLSYYSSTDNPDSAPSVHRGWRPVITPITEESLSQLSPPAPYTAGDRRDSQRHQPLGARSPASPGRIRSMLSPQRSASESAASSLPLQLVNGRPPSTSFTTALSVASSRSNGSQLSINIVDEPLQPPPSLSKVFNRQRSGSAPSPIQVDRDEDLSKYSIAVHNSGSGEAPATSDHFTQVQEFPESATAPWSAFSAVTQSIDAPPLPEVPVSAGLPLSMIQPNAAQQLLLARAASSARARHSRQSSLGNPGSHRGQPFAPLVPPAGRIEEEEQEPVLPSTPRTPTGFERSSRPTPPRKPPPKRSLPPSPSGGTQTNLRPPSALPELPAPTSAPTSEDPSGSSGALVVRSPSSATSVRSTDSGASNGSQLSARPSLKSLPPIPITPASSPASSPPAQVARGPRPRVPQPLQLSEASVHGVRAEGSETSANEPSDSAEHSSGPPSQDRTIEQPVSPPLPPQSSQSRKSTNTIDELLRASTALGSPPPYYSVVDQHAHPMPPTFRLQQAAPLPIPPTTPALPAAATANTPVAFGNPFSNQPRESTGSSRSRLARPAGPMGPRGPSAHGPAMARERSGSVSSLPHPVPPPPSGPPPSVPAPGVPAMLSPQRSLRRRAAVEASTPLSPKFQPAAVKHRGYTMEAAKWTFSSSQLQGIVSKAIRESAQTSAIRLLKLESLEIEIPDDIHRLEMHRTDIKSKYKAHTRRRATLFESLTFHLTSSGDRDSTFALRITEELSSIATTLDQLAEELHSTDLQLAQLNTLVQVHSKSALSMALRKLNASFLKQVADNQALQERIVAVEAERDEAWKHAEDIANEYDHLHFHPSPDSPASASNRSSRVSAKRKSSIRVSKAGLRSVVHSRRQSARSSVASSAYGPLSATPLSSRSVRGEKIPPLPPIPKRRPADIITDYQSPLRSSPGLMSNEATPDSETRALDQAEEELYTMLGLSAPGPMKRSRSMVGQLPSAGLSPLPPPTGALSPLHRRPSLPGGATLVEAQNAMNADRNAVVFTFQMLQDEDSEDVPRSGSGFPFNRY
ncbi:hypothetical protein D9611_009235 [Ephemerocybe angulata]|uniref:Uncharacterized protein n=1 Tax=Ephemerocybe angulata TaxID=980116 RepID=A0A8H5F4M9_9AGAR|nr:hypothetical protein D9611_009235 [Tulosesus angulatus]